MDSEESRARLQSWRGVAGLLEETYLAEQQERSTNRDTHSRPSIAIRGSHTVPPVRGELLSGQSLASPGTYGSPLALGSLFDVSTSIHRSPLRSERTSAEASSSRNSSSIPITPFRTSVYSQTTEPIHRTSILTSPIRSSRDSSRRASSTPSRQASEITIRPPQDQASVPLATGASIDNVLSTSPSSIGIQSESSPDRIEHTFEGNESQTKQHRSSKDLPPELPAVPLAPNSGHPSISNDTKPKGWLPSLGSTYVWQSVLRC
jgi:hypothetical protein